MLGYDRVRGGELKKIFEENCDFFEKGGKNHDAEFNVLAFFILFEKLKGEKSFWHPYLDLVEESYTLFDWNKNEVGGCENKILSEEYKEYIDEMMDCWLKS
jgi:hypothetical protein